MAVQRRQQQCQWKEPQENRSPSFLNQAVLLTYRQLAKGGMMTKPQKGAIRLGIMAALLVFATLRADSQPVANLPSITVYKTPT